MHAQIRHCCEEGVSSIVLFLFLALCDIEYCFSYVITEPADQSWGHRLTNGTWVGMTGMLMREVSFCFIASMCLLYSSLMANEEWK